jgi:predicted component of viral defense system (DUF524 family)
VTDTTSSGFDPEQFKDLQRRQWDEDAPGWHRWKGTLKRWFAVVILFHDEDVGLLVGA